VPYTTTTLAAIQVILDARLDHVPWITSEEQRLAINEALLTWNLLTGRWRRRYTVSTGNGTVEYALPATMIYGMRVLVSGRVLTPASLLDLDLIRPSWRSETVATGGEVPTVPIIWAPVSIQRIAIWPALASVIVNGLVVDGVSNTPVLVEAGDTADLGEEVLDLVIDFTVHLLTFKEAGPRWRATRPFYEAFLQAAAEENSVLKANQAFRRYAGLERGRTLQKAKGVPTALDGIGPGGAGATA
jgi:hypothetical protein